MYMHNTTVSSTYCLDIRMLTMLLEAHADISSFPLTLALAMKCAKARQSPWPSGLAPPLAQGVILKTQDQVPLQAPCVEPASLPVSLPLSLFLSLS